MRISKFKLIDGGLGGIEVSAKEYITGGQWKIIDQVKRIRKIPLSSSLISDVQKLKYFFLNITGHWIEPYSNHFDSVKKTIHPVAENSARIHLTLKNIWNRTEITGAVVGENGQFLITGTVEGVDGKRVGISTPYIAEDDDISFHGDCLSVLTEIGTNISEYFNMGSVLVEKSMKELPGEVGYTEEQVIEKALDKLQQRGAIIIMDADRETESEDETTAEEIPEAELESDDEFEPKQQPEEKPKEKSETDVTDKKVNPFGAPAANIPADVSGEVPVPAGPDEKANTPEDLSNLEHSESMGIIEDADKGTEKGADEW